MAHLTRVEGIFAGAGIILIGRSANGILGFDWLAERVHLPWVRDGKPKTVREIGSGMLEGNAGVAS